MSLQCISTPLPIAGRLTSPPRSTIGQSSKSDIVAARLVYAGTLSALSRLHFKIELGEVGTVLAAEATAIGSGRECVAVCAKALERSG